MKYLKKVRSGALQLTVFIAIMIALLLSGLLLYAYTIDYMKEESKGAIANIKFADSGIDYLLKQQDFTIDTLNLDFVEKANQTLKVHLSQWGIYQKAVSVAQFRNKVFTKIAIMGTLNLPDVSPTLYLQESYNALSVVGKTKITGNVFLPSAGIKTGYIGGEGYYGSQLIDGATKQSTSTLPKLDKNVVATISYYLKDYKPQKQEDFIDLVPKKCTNSFNQTTKNVYSLKAIIIENKEIIGNIIIKSDSLIKIKRTTLLKDVLLIAPIVEIEEGTAGSFQVFASKKIVIGKNCSLTYPSALVLYQDTQKNPNTFSSNQQDNMIFIDSGTTVRGCVSYFQTSEKTDFTTQILIEKDSKIKGQVYVEGNVELKGTVSGAVYTRQFIANQFGSIYVNHIYNGVIENSNLPGKYGGILFENQPKIVMKWLY